jgi:hypothetical protein
VLPPEHTEAFDDTDIFGNAVTETETVWLFAQLPELPVTVYVIEEDGDATTDEPVVEFNAVDGDHE